MKTKLTAGEITTTLILDRFAKKWMKDNDAFLDDYRELCVKLLNFRMMWGVEIGFIFKNSEEVKGRELGVGIVEELFNAPDFVNKAKKYKEKPFKSLIDNKE